MNAARATALALPIAPWQRAILERGRDRLGRTNCGTLARLALRDILLKAGEDVSLVVIHTWSREQQGCAYLWALGRVNGVEEPPPFFVEYRPR